MNKLAPQSIYYSLIYFSTFLATQRFTLPDIYIYACIIPMIMSVYVFYKRKLEQFNTLVLICFFTCTDIGINADEGTTAFMRYAIYLLGLINLFLYKNISIKKIALFFIVSTFYLTLTLINIESINKETFIRDLFILVLCFGLFVLTDKTKYILDIKLIINALLVYMAFELINGALFFDASIHGYLNYASLKSMILIPIAYYAIEKKYVILSLLTPITALILLWYTTRFLALTLIIVLLFGFLKAKLKDKIIFSIFIIITIGAIIVNNIYIDKENLESTKLLNSIAVIIQSDNNLDQKLYELDPVRYGELALLLDRNFFSILFGSGLGAGVYDTHGFFSRIDADNNFAFSKEELYSGFYYNLHDLWTDVGLRFGLVPIFIVIFSIIRSFNTSGKTKQFYGIILLIALLNMFFSTLGLITIAIITRAYLSSEIRHKANSI